MFMKCHLWSNTHFLRRPATDDDHREGVTLGTAIMINLDTVADMVDKGNNPPAVQITFKRDEARDPIDVYGSVAVLARMMELAGADGSTPVVHLKYATFGD